MLAHAPLADHRHHADSLPDHGGRWLLAAQASGPCAGLHRLMCVTLSVDTVLSGPLFYVLA
jgi:hypothetical protein